MQFLKKYVLYIAWFQALIATIGSLIFSEVLKFPPCVLCWEQRIAMYPLVWILTVGIIKKDKNIVIYAIPFTIAGLLIGIYHNLLYYGIVPESAAPCIAGVSCTTKFIEWFGFITIPFLSLFAFVVITTALLIHAKLNRK